MACYGGTVTETFNTCIFSSTNLIVNDIVTGSSTLSGTNCTVGTLASVGAVNFGYSSTLGAWSSAAQMNTGRYANAGAGSQTSAITMGGTSPTLGLSGCTETYNGIGWTAVTSNPTRFIYSAMVGASNSAALSFGGSSYGAVACAYSYNGSWSAITALITGRAQLAGAGTTTAALAIGGYTSPGVSCTEAYNGSTWASGGALITIRNAAAAAGASNTSALAFGPGGCAEGYNGTSWSACAAMITSRVLLGGAGRSTNNALAFGGVTPVAVKNTECFNGVSWSSVSSTNLTRSCNAAAGSSTAALSAGNPSSTELFNSPAVLNTVSYSNTNGTLTAGNISVTSLVETSAQRYKSNVTQLTSQLDKINQLRPVEFDWKSNQRHDIGFIAEDVQKIYPEVVNTNDQGEVEGLSYSKMVSLLVKGMQEQQQQIKSLTDEINNLKNK
jgi:hypothetical protein